MIYREFYWFFHYPGLSLTLVFYLMLLSRIYLILFFSLSLVSFAPCNNQGLAIRKFHLINITTRPVIGRLRVSTTWRPSWVIHSILCGKFTPTLIYFLLKTLQHLPQRHRDSQNILSINLGYNLTKFWISWQFSLIRLKFPCNNNCWMGHKRGGSLWTPFCMYEAHQYNLRFETFNFPRTL